MANLLTFVRYECDGEIEETFRFYRPLHSNATAEAIFDILNDFIISNDINWSKCVGLSTDGARAMMGPTQRTWLRCSLTYIATFTERH